MTGGRPQADLRLDLVEQLERFAARPVVLVEEGQDGQAPGSADLEQLERLGLDALGGVEDHDDGVDAGEDPVRVLGEVAVAGRVEQVDDVVAVGELEDGRADRDAPLAFQLHPVRRRGPSSVARLDGAGALHGAGVEEELLGEGRLAGVGVADDRERAPACRLPSHQFLIHDHPTLAAAVAWSAWPLRADADAPPRVVTDDPDRHRYEITYGGDLAGFAVYHRRGNRTFFVHTEIDPAFEGHGLGSALVAGMLDAERARPEPIVPLCPFVRSYIDRHPEYGDLVDHDMLDRIDGT